MNAASKYERFNSNISIYNHNSMNIINIYIIIHNIESADKFILPLYI